MGESKITFGDKLFLYGQYLTYIEEFEEYDYNAVMGYMTIGGYMVRPVETIDNSASVSGFVVDLGQSASLTVSTPFTQMEMIDVTNNLARSLPLPSGTKIWMPTTRELLEYSPHTQN